MEQCGSSNADTVSHAIKVTYELTLRGNILKYQETAYMYFLLELKFNIVLFYVEM